MPWSVLRVVLGLAVVAAGAGLWLGLHRAPLTETEAIETAVQRYVAETGGKRTDCVAVPGNDAAVWIVVNCGTAARISRYRIGYDGGLIDAPRGPQT